jgi:hypothetical protein
MSTLIPSITSCKFDTPGERRFVRLLAAKLEDDYRYHAYIEENSG